MKIYKYPLNYQPIQTITIPYCAAPLSVAVQYNELVLYAMVDTEKHHTTEVQVKIIGTGHEFAYPKATEDFQGTFVMHGGRLVWHVWTETIF